MNFTTFQETLFQIAFKARVINVAAAPFSTTLFPFPSTYCFYAQHCEEVASLALHEQGRKHNMVKLGEQTQIHLSKQVPITTLF